MSAYLDIARVPGGVFFGLDRDIIGYSMVSTAHNKPNSRGYGISGCILYGAFIFKHMHVLNS